MEGNMSNNSGFQQLLLDFADFEFVESRQASGPERRINTLRRFRQSVNWKDEGERDELLRELVRRFDYWTGPLPDLRDIFGREMIENLLEPPIEHSWESIGSSVSASVKSFVIETGYKDEPDHDEDGKPMLRRTTLVHTAFQRGCSADFIHSLFEQIYNRYDMNYISDDAETSHFHVACAVGLIEDAQKFLDVCDENSRPALLKLKNAEGNTALFLALKYRRLELAEFLMKNGASVSVANAKGLRPIHVVCQKKEFSVPTEEKRQEDDDDDDDDSLKWFLDVCNSLEKKVEIDVRDYDDRRPLHYALECYKTRTVELLIGLGADSNRADAHGTTPLHVLCKRKAVSRDYDDFAINWFFDICLGKVIDFDVEDKEGRRPLHFALANGKTRTAELLLALGADPKSADTKDSTPLHAIASYHGTCQWHEQSFKTDVVSMIERRKLGSVWARDAEGNTPLHLAVRSGNRALVDWLLNNNADIDAVNAENSSPLHLVCGRAYQARGILDTLLAFGERFDRPLSCINQQDLDGNTPLHLALISSDDRQLIESLLHHGADPNSVNKMGKTPLILICENYGKRVDMALAFFAINDAKQNQVWLDARDNIGCSTALHFALSKNDKELFKLLLRRGADPNVGNKFDRTSAHIICLKLGYDGFLEEVYGECERIDLEARDNRGRSVLHHAMMNGCDRTIEFLLRRRVNPNLLDQDGKTPLHSTFQSSFRKHEDTDVLRLMQLFFRVCDEVGMQVDMDVRDELDKMTPLELAVARTIPDLVNLLVKRGAGRVNFEYPRRIDANHVTRSEKENRPVFSFRVIASVLAIAHRLESTINYRFTREDNATMLKFVETFFESFLTTFTRMWKKERKDVHHDDREDASYEDRARRWEVKPGLSLLDLSQPKEEITFEDYLELAKSTEVLEAFELYKVYFRGCKRFFYEHLYETITRKWFVKKETGEKNF